MVAKQRTWLTVTWSLNVAETRFTTTDWIWVEKNYVTNRINVEDFGVCASFVSDKVARPNHTLLTWVPYSNWGMMGGSPNEVHPCLFDCIFLIDKLLLWFTGVLLTCWRTFPYTPTPRRAIGLAMIVADDRFILKCAMHPFGVGTKEGGFATISKIPNMDFCFIDKILPDSLRLLLSWIKLASYSPIPKQCICTHR